MKCICYIVWIVLFLSCKGRGETLLAQEGFPNAKATHTLWNDLLQRHVDSEGNVSYIGFKAEVDQLQVYLDHLAQNPPVASWREAETLAYFINLYNAATVQLIIDHYPLQSIRDIPSRWKRKWISVGNTLTSLHAIEHDVLRNRNEPRIHFAINCASYSCPKLLNTAFTAQNTERLLTKAAIDFVNDTKRNRFENGTAHLSKIFKWYKSDFTENHALLEYINLYLQHPIRIDSDVEYLDYDWRLNEAQ